MKHICETPHARTTSNKANTARDACCRSMPASVQQPLTEQCAYACCSADPCFETSARLYENNGVMAVIRRLSTFRAAPRWARATLRCTFAESWMPSRPKQLCLVRRSTIGRRLVCTQCALPEWGLPIVSLAAFCGSHGGCRLDRCRARRELSWPPGRLRLANEAPSRARGFIPRGGARDVARSSPPPGQQS